ncbi:MAG: MoxR family ATPase [Clostridia bacterium]|nr:MoxR family ATPase [Clostridia bacterium]
MNIKEAKEEVKRAITSYLMKDDFGDYVISRVRQRPVFLIGDPGIGKTAIMEQISEELGIGLVSYSMTHHTRQSAIGLPKIVTKIYDGREYEISEYTMSEIIASVYDKIEETGIKEGILFLDEINCVSETLAPAMLQFLQYKTFGKHEVPEGWVIVTAGNPPEHNKSVREFDVATLDRVKKITIDPDFAVWKEYAYKKGIHRAILTYLEIKKNDFYRIENTVDGEQFVTARGWEDLSTIIKLYEEQEYAVDEQIISEYIQHEKVCKEFAIYYDLYNKYKSDYQIQNILDGTYSDEIAERAKNAKFDERLVLIGLMLEALTQRAKDDVDTEDYMIELHGVLAEFKRVAAIAAESVDSILGKYIVQRTAAYKEEKRTTIMTKEREHVLRRVILTIEKYKNELAQLSIADVREGFEMVKEWFSLDVAEMKKHLEDTQSQLENMFLFVEAVFEDQEMLVAVTELTANYYTAKFISRYGCDKYFEHNKELLVYERQQELLSEIKLLNENDEIDISIL